MITCLNVTSMETLECKKLVFLAIMLHGLSEFWKSAVQLHQTFIRKFPISSLQCHDLLTL